MKPLAAAAVLLAFAGSALAQLASLEVIDREFAGMIRDAAPSVVRVGIGRVEASGVVISPDGFIVTHLSVARDPKMKAAGARAAVTVPGRGTLEAELIASDAATGTALLRVAGAKSLPAARPGRTEDLAVGQFLVTIGNSFGSAQESQPAATLGLLAAIYRSADGQVDRLESSAATNPGQAGGPYFDADGALIGLARELPNGSDLATVTPIGRVRDAYAGVPGGDRLFDKPSTLGKQMTRARLLSQAFAIAARRARGGLVTLELVRRAAGATATAAEGAEKKGPPALPVRKGPVTATLVDARGIALAAAPPFTDDVESIQAHLADGTSTAARVLARDRKIGLVAVILELAPGTQLPLLEEAPASELDIGQFTVAVGSPFLPGSADPMFVTAGLLSGQHRLDAYSDALETDAGVNGKNAGGALVDLRGRLLGVLLPPALPFGQDSGLGFALPLVRVREILPRLLDGRDVERPYLGVTMAPPPAGKKGALVGEVAADQPAARAGLEKGDLITALDGMPIADPRAFSDYLARSKAAGDALEVTALRGGQAVQLRVVLGKRPE